jgi:hypothetical protein
MRLRLRQYFCRIWNNKIAAVQKVSLAFGLMMINNKPFTPGILNLVDTDYRHDYASHTQRLLNQQ